MNEKDKQMLKEMLSESILGIMQEQLAPMVGEIAAAKSREIVQTMMAQRAIFGRDVTGLSQKQKKDFAAAAIAAAKGDFRIDTKANEALLLEQDNRGGYLVSQEVADAIMRIAASVGTILSQASKWPMSKDELAIPNYTGSFLTGAYIGVDAVGTITGLAFGQAVLTVKKWQLAFAVGNDLLADANVNLGEWLLALAGESLANMIDQQGFVGGYATSVNGVTVQGPFQGLLGLSTTTTIDETGAKASLYYLGNSSTSGKTGFSNIDIIADISNMIGNIEESLLEGLGIYVHRSNWASMRAQKDTAGNYVLPYASWAPEFAENLPMGGPVRPAGYVLGHPVYTNRWLPKAGDTAVSTPFVVVGNMKAMAFGDRGEFSVEQFTSGSFGGKEIALADQRGLVYKHRHALVTVLPRAFVIGSTSAS